MTRDKQMGEGEADGQGAGAFAPFRYPAFRAIWIANLWSSLGSNIQSVAAAWLMTDLSPSHRMVALVQASTTIPIMLLGVFAGAIADNFDRRRVMLTAQFAMFAVSILLAVLTLQGVMTPWPSVREPRSIRRRGRPWCARRSARRTCRRRSRSTPLPSTWHAASARRWAGC